MIYYSIKVLLPNVSADSSSYQKTSRCPSYMGHASHGTCLTPWTCMETYHPFRFIMCSKRVYHTGSSSMEHHTSCIQSVRYYSGEPDINHIGIITVSAINCNIASLQYINALMHALMHLLIISQVASWRHIVYGMESSLNNTDILSKYK